MPSATSATNFITRQRFPLLVGRVGIALMILASLYIFIAGSVHLWSLCQWALIASDGSTRLPGANPSVNEISPLIRDQEDGSGDADDTEKFNSYRRRRWYGVALGLVSVLVALLSFSLRLSMFWEVNNAIYIFEFYTGSLWLLAQSYAFVLYFLAAFVTSVDAPRFSSGLLTFSLAAFLASALQAFMGYATGAGSDRVGSRNRILTELHATVAIISLLIVMTFPLNFRFRCL